LNRTEVSTLLTKCKYALRCKLEIADRTKNFNFITGLGLIRQDIFDIIDSLEVDDFLNGPITDETFKGELFEFGKNFYGREIYIKLKICDFDYSGEKQLTLNCVSFHSPERPLKYKFK